jgi:hypothetical protein
MIQEWFIPNYYMRFLGRTAISSRETIYYLDDNIDIPDSQIVPIMHSHDIVWLEFNGRLYKSTNFNYSALDMSRDTGSYEITIHHDL